ncbi:GNAT family N-acetyltransferase [Chloroflexota bacterium]
MTQFSYTLITNETELEDAFNVRREVFVREQEIPKEIEMDEYDSEALHVIVRTGDTVIGTARARFPAENTAKIERMAVLNDFRRRGVGSGIIDFLTGEFRKNGTSHLILHAQCVVADFYKSCGFEESGEPFMEAGIEHIQMEKRL